MGPMRTLLLAVLCGALAAAAVPERDGRPARAAARAPSPPAVPARYAGTPDAPDLEQPPVDLSRKASTPPREGPPRTTRYVATLHNLHTRELLPLTAETAGAGAGTVQERLDHFLRCRVTHRTARMATAPVDVALEMAERFGAARIEIVSGYRSAKLNEILRKKGHEVAETSRHLRGHALDFRIPGVGAARLARAAGEVHQGGIGTYRQSGFVHVDIGRDRRWRGR